VSLTSHQTHIKSCQKFLPGTGSYIHTQNNQEKIHKT